MASKSHDLTHGPLVQQIILFSLPLMATNVLQVLFNMSDVAVVGQFAGPEALGSVGSTSILVSLFTGFLIGMGSGVNVVVARYIGARHDQDVHEAVHTSLILSLIVGVIIMALGFLFTPAMLSMLGTKPVLMAGAVSYLRIYCLGMPAMAVFNFGNAVLSAAGDTKKPLYFLSMAGVINILLNLFFVIVCHLAAAGVALASIISLILAHEGRADGVNGSHHVVDERVGVRGGGVAFHHQLIKGVHARLNEQVRYCENRVLQTGGNAQRQHLPCLVRLNPQHRPFQPHHAP